MSVTAAKGFTAAGVKAGIKASGTHDLALVEWMADRVLVLSNRPTRVVEDIRVALPRPRDQISTRAEPEYLALRERVLTLIRSMRSPA